MNPWDQFTGANAGYVLELFERYQRDPASVDEATRAVFRDWTPPQDAAPLGRRPVAAAAMLQPSLAAVSPGRVDPPLTAISPRGSIRSASTRRSATRRCMPQAHGLTTDAAAPAARRHRRRAGGRRARANAYEAIERLRAIYCATHRPRLRPRVRARRAGVAARVGRGAPASARRTIRSTAASCSIGSRRSRASSASCTAPSPARRASRSRGWT